MAEVDFKTMSAAELVTHLKDQGLSLSKQAPLWGVSKLQVHYYKTGYTRQPSPDVCMNVFKRIRVEGKPVLIDIYKTPEDLEQAYNAYTA